jgi:hypothetical protein
MTVKMGGPMPPMGGMPMNNPMMPRQPMNPLPPPMPVPPIVPPQAAGTFPVNKDKRKRFGDSLETMLARPPMVASDQMANMNVFTGQMMNTARPPVVQQMRGGGNVRQMYRDAYSSPSFKSYTDSKKNTYAPNPTNTRKTHEEIMASVRGASSPNDDRPAPVAMNFNDEQYTPTSAELNEALKDTAAIGMPDMRRDQSDVQMPVFPDLDDRINRRIDDSNAFLSYISKYGTQGTPEDRATILAPGTGGLSSVPSIPSGTSSTLAQNMITFPQSPDTSMQPGPADPNTFISDVFEAPVDDSSYFGDLGGNQIRDDSSYFGDFGGNQIMDSSSYFGDLGGNQIKDDSSYFGDLGLGDTSLRPRIRPEGGGQAGTGTGEEDDRGFVEKLVDDVKAVPGNIMRDLQMGIAAGFYGNYDEARANLEKALNPDGTRKYSDADITSWINRTKETVENNKRQTQGQSTDDDSPMSTSPVDPCPPGMRLDPVAGICVPVEEGEDEGPSLSLNRTRDDEFSELDDLMGKIVKPVGEDVKTMQAGGSVGLNRAADNFLAAMGA